MQIFKTVKESIECWDEKTKYIIIESVEKAGNLYDYEEIQIVDTSKGLDPCFLGWNKTFCVVENIEDAKIISESLNKKLNTEKSIEFLKKLLKDGQFFMSAIELEHNIDGEELRKEIELIISGHEQI
jgi:hypothetical protein